MKGLYRFEKVLEGLDSLDGGLREAADSGSKGTLRPVALMHECQGSDVLEAGRWHSTSRENCS